MIHATGGSLVLLVSVVSSRYKPRGMTRYGWRKQHDGVQYGCRRCRDFS